MKKITVTKTREVTLDELELGDAFEVEIAPIGSYRVTVEKINDGIITLFFKEIVSPLDMFMSETYNHVTAVTEIMNKKWMIDDKDSPLDSVIFRLPTSIELYGDEDNKIEPEFNTYKSRPYHRCRLYGTKLMGYLLGDKDESNYKYVDHTGYLGTVSMYNTQFPERLGVCPVMEIDLSKNS